MQSARRMCNAAWIRPHGSGLEPGHHPVCGRRSPCRSDRWRLTASA